MSLWFFRERVFCGHLLCIPRILCLLCQYNWLVFLPPANEVCEGYVFTPVCQSICSQEGCLPQCMLGYTHPYPPGSRHPPPPGASRHLPRSRHSGNRHTPGADTPLHSPCLEIGATNRRHTPYWNAILLHRLLKTKFHCNSWIGMSLKSFALYTN